VLVLKTDRQPSTQGTPQSGVQYLHLLVTLEANLNLEPAKSSTELSKVKFGGAFRYNETWKVYYREHDPVEPQSIGPPSPEIDQAWEELLGGI
jgi:hypothetical protein